MVASGVTAVRTNIFNRRLAVMSAKDVDPAFIFEGKGFSAISPEGVVLPEKQTVLSTDFKPSKVFSESVDYSIQTGLPREAEVLTFESGETLTRAVPTAQEVARTRRITFESEKLGSEISGSQTGLSSLMLMVLILSLLLSCLFLKIILGLWLLVSFLLVKKAVFHLLSLVLLVVLLHSIYLMMVLV